MTTREHSFATPAILRAAFAVILVLSPAVASAQQRIDRMAVLTVETNMYYLRKFHRTPMYVLPAGTHVRVVERHGAFYEVVYDTGTFGAETGYIQTSNVEFVADGQLPGSGGPSSFFSHRGFVEVQGFRFASVAPNDTTRAVGDTLAREETFFRLAHWLRAAAGVDFRANTHDQVEDTWDFDTDDRSILRPRLALRRLSATVTASRLTVEAGKQFIRWGRADILNPTDRFAPRDELNVFDSQFLPVWGVRPSVQIGNETFEAAWVPQMTPTRLPLIDQRWTVVPREANGLTLRDNGSLFPKGREVGARWTHAARFEAGLSFFDGFNYLPNIDVQPAADGAVEFARTYPRLRSYGSELSVPLPQVTVKAEAAYFTFPEATNEEYVLYVVELERQVGEWILDGGYAGDVSTRTRPYLAFDAERGVARSFIGRAAYTVDPRRTVAIEGAARQNGDGVYVKGEYSQTFGQHWRLTLAGIGIRGQDGDFIGQFHRNSHASAALRLSF